MSGDIRWDIRDSLIRLAGDAHARGYNAQFINIYCTSINRLAKEIVLDKQLVTGIRKAADASLAKLRKPQADA